LSDPLTEFGREKKLKAQTGELKFVKAKQPKKRRRGKKGEERKGSEALACHHSRYRAKVLVRTYIILFTTSPFSQSILAENPE